MEGKDANIINEENIKLELKDTSRTSKAKQTSVETVSVECTSASSPSQDVPIISVETVQSNKSIGTKTKKNGPSVSTKRKRESGKRIQRANNTDSFESSWSELDKQRLLIALQRFGVMDIDNLSKAVPGKSEEDIKKFINFKWRITRLELRSRLKETRKLKGDKSPYLGPVDKWLEILESASPKLDHYKTNPLAHAVLLIWKYEKHPDPSECGGVDFKALYEYLYYMLSGFPPKHLNQPTAAYLSASLRNFACGMKNADSNMITKFLTSPVTVNFPKKVDINEEDIPAAFSFTKEQCLDELTKLPGFNPFCVPRDNLKKKVSVIVGEEFPTVARGSSVTATPTPSTTTASSNASATASTSSKRTIIPITAPTSSNRTINPVTTPTSSKRTIIPVTAPTSSNHTIIPVTAPTSSKRNIIPVIASTSGKHTILRVAASTSGTPTIIPVTPSTSKTPTIIPVTRSTSRKSTIIPVTASACTTPSTIPAAAACPSTSGVHISRTNSRTISKVPNASQIITKVSTSITTAKKN